MSRFHYFHDIGGSMPPEHPTYIERDADNILFEKLNEGQLCYILSARQMGKSSLRQRTMRRLKKVESIKCTYIDIVTLKEAIANQEKWYFLFILELNNNFNLCAEKDIYEWWYHNEQNKILPPSLRLDKFFNDILLVKIIEKNIVIFLDEIDFLVATYFKDNFLGFIRSCYDKRPEKNEYKRLTFCLLGAIAPSDLIQNKQQAFNIGIEIELTGLDLLKAENSFIFGLENIVKNPKFILNEIFIWTGGQPFLTQQLCQLVVDKAEKGAADINTLIKEYVIYNWARSQEHFKYITENLIEMKENKHPFFLLSLWRKIVKNEVVDYDDNNYSHIALKILGLVKIDQNKIVPFNKLYCEIYNVDWIDNRISSLTQQQWKEVPNVLDLSRNSLAHISEFINNLIKPLIHQNFIYIIIFFISIESISILTSYFWFTCDAWKQKFDYQGHGALIEIIRGFIIIYFYYYFLGNLFKKEAEDILIHHRHLWIRILAITVAIIFMIYEVIYHLYVAPKDLNYGQFSLKMCVVTYLFYLPATIINTILIGIPFIIVTVYSSFINIYEYAIKIISCYDFINEMNEEAQVLARISSAKENLRYIIKDEFNKLFDYSIIIFTNYFVLLISLLFMLLFELFLGYHTLSERGAAIILLYYLVVSISTLLIFILGFVAYQVNFRNAYIFLLRINSIHQEFKSKYNSLKLIRRVISKILKMPFTYIILFSAVLLLLVKPLG